MYPLHRGLPKASIASTLARRCWRPLGLAAGLALGVLAAQAQNAPTFIDVKAGDTFSGLAAPFTNGVGGWKKMYRPHLSNLANPNQISAGMRFELVTEANGAPYLRLVNPGAFTAAAPAPASTMAPAAAPRVVQAPAPSAVPAAAAPVVTPPPMQPAGGFATVPPRTDDTLVIGVLPYIPGSVLHPQYEHLKRYLERVDGQKVRVVVPATFKAFFDNTMSGEYDVAVAAPHFARVAQLDRNMVPVGMYEPRINALLVTPVDSKMTGVRDAREKAIAFANPQSLVALFGYQWLSQQNMEAGRDYEVKGARTDLGVGRMLLSGDAVAAVMSNGEFRALPQDEVSRMKIMESFASMPNFVILAHPRLAPERILKLKAHLKAFLADKEDGAAFARATNFSAIVEADESKLRELDAFTAVTRRTMGLTK